MWQIELLLTTCVITYMTKLTESVMSSIVEKQDDTDWYWVDVVCSNLSLPLTPVILYISDHHKDQLLVRVGGENVHVLWFFYHVMSFFCPELRTNTSGGLLSFVRLLPFRRSLFVIRKTSSVEKMIRIKPLSESSRKFGIHSCLQCSFQKTCPWSFSWDHHTVFQLKKSSPTLVIFTSSSSVGEVWTRLYSIFILSSVWSGESWVELERLGEKWWKSLIIIDSQDSVKTEVTQIHCVDVQT